MNRPTYNIQYGQRSGKNLMFLQYVELLESYCDELEKALDKAVWCIVNNIDFLANTKKTEEEWKEWFKEKWY